MSTAGPSGRGEPGSGPACEPSSDKPAPVKRYRRNELDEEDANKNIFAVDDDEPEYVPVKKRGRAALYPSAPSAEAQADAVQQPHDANGASAAPETAGPSRGKESLLIAAARARAEAPEKTEADKELEEEKELMEMIAKKQALKSVKELAQGVTYTRAMYSGWKPPLKARLASEEGTAPGWPPASPVVMDAMALLYMHVLRLRYAPWQKRSLDAQRCPMSKCAATVCSAQPVSCQPVAN